MLKRLLATVFLVFLMTTLSIRAFEKVTFSKYETEHQILYFSSNLDRSVIPRLIRQAKKSEEFLKALYGWIPDEKIVTVYDRETDMANGWSRSYLKKTIFLYTYPPERYSTLSSYSSWEQGLHVHEYTHSLQIGNTKGFPKYFNMIFGNLYFPGGRIPIWALEGAAVYSESMINGKGRLHSPLYKSYFNSFFLKGNELSLGELSGVSDHWMGGGLSYLFGTFFYSYIIEKKGKKKAGEFFEELSDDIVPFMANIAARKALGSSLSNLYEDFIKENRKKVLGKKQKADGIYGVKERFTFTYVDLNADSYIFSGSSIGRRKIYRYYNDKLEKIFSPPSHTAFSMGPDRILMPVKISHEDRYTREELFVIDKVEKKVNRLTENGGVLEAVFGPDGDIFFSSYRDGINRITRMDEKGKVKKEWELRELDSIYSLSFSKKGKLVFTGNLYDREKNIFLFDTDSGDLTEIKIDGDQYSAYFNTENEIVFSSELDDRIVPMSLDLKTSEIFQLYEPELMTLFPKVIGKELYFIAFDNDGYFPAHFPVNKKLYRKLPAGLMVKVEREDKPGVVYRLDKAKFYEGMLPSLIVPDYYGSSLSHTIGVTIHGQSNDEERSYSLYYSKTFGGTGRHYAEVNYFDKAVWPGFRSYFSYSRNSGKTGSNYPADIDVDRFNTGISLTSSYQHPTFTRPTRVLKLSHTVRASLGLSALHATMEKNSDPLEIVPDVNNNVSLKSAFSYGLSFSFNPGSYLLTSTMNSFSVSFPVSFSKSLANDSRYLSFSPRATFSFLILRNGKLGLVSRHSLYMRFFSDSYYLLGGDELDIDILNLNTFIYGGSSNVTVRGYEYGAAGGKHVYFMNNELRFHLLSIERGFGLVPLMLKNLQGAIFCDYGVGSRDINIFNKKFIASAGAEVKLYTYWWYRVPVIFTLGAAYGLTQSGRLNIYFSMGNSF